MAISEHDRQVLQDLENDLLAEDQGSSSLSIRGRPATLLSAFAGLTIGLVVVFVGLSVTGPLGTVIGVIGSLIFAGGAWLGINYASRWLTSRPRRDRDDSTP